MTVEDEKKKVALERVAANLPVEVGATAAAASMTALVQARFTVAARMPRIWLQVRSDLIKECSRPSFALEDVEGKGNSALYRKPVGGGHFAEGLGIRFAEVAERCMGNIMTGAITVQESATERVKYCFVLDLQTNNSWEDTVHISKTVERRETREGDEIISSRINSTGQVVYRIVAQEDALVTKEAALISKKLRTLILRLVPGDLQDECREEIKRVRREKIKEDPDAALHRLIDGMARVNVDVIMLEAYLGHPIQQCTSPEIVNLQGIYAALNDGETTWAEIMADVDTARKMKPPPSKEADKKDKGIDAVKEKVAAEKQKAQETKPVTATPTPPVEPVVAATPVVAPVTPPVEPTQPVTQPQATAPAAEQPAQPAWAAPAEQPVVTEQPAPVVTPPATAPIVAEAPKGQVIKGVQFPAVIKAVSAEDACTPEQLVRAEAALTVLNTRLGKNFTMKGNMSSWFKLGVEEISKDAMEAVITLLTNWP